MDKIPTVEDVREQRIAFVAEHWGRMSIEEICERLGKSRKAVYSMVERYRDRIPRLRMRVNDEELDYIAEHSDMTSLHIGKALGRSHHTVRKYRSVLRDAGRLAYERTPWTPDDDAIVMSLPLRSP